MMKIFINKKNAIITAATLCASALAAILCCGCSDEYGLGDAFVKQRMVTVSFDANGGSPSDISSITIMPNRTLKWIFPDNPIRAGYRFDGWFDREVKYDSDTKITKSVTLTAEWTEIVYGSLTDTRDGKTYKTVKIGNQNWMAENLNYAADSSWCYNYNTSNCATYGRLYYGDAVMTACPDGWHLPTRNEWNMLISYMGDSSTAGKKLKSTSGWKDDWWGKGTDDYGFSAMPGGYQYSGSGFNGVGTVGVWWGAAEHGYVYNLAMYYDDNRAVVSSSSFSNSGKSVRCVNQSINTLTVNANNTAYGTVTPSLQANIAIGTPVNISATANSGRAFANWMVTQGFAAFADPTSETTTVTLYSDATVTANFRLQMETGSLAYGGQTYNTVKVGNLWWMAENLNYAMDNSWCYDGLISNCEAYGRLYAWDAANRACSEIGGWRLPTQEEWNALVSYAGGGSGAGKHLKSFTGWCKDWSGRDHEFDGTDDFGFSALPGGERSDNDKFYGVGYRGYWWSASGIWSMTCQSDLDSISYYTSAISVRCVGGASTYTLTVDAINQTYGKVTPLGQTSVIGGTPIEISATANSGRTFVNWKVARGNATLADPSSVTTTVTLSSDATVTAIFRLPGSFEYGGQTYNTVKIGNLWWMAKNLNYETEEGSWCYDNDNYNCGVYGRLYTWEVAKSACSGINDGSRAWHLPSNVEWNSLMEAVGGVRQTDSYNEYYYTNAAEALKSKSGWYMGLDYNNNGTDDFGFSALPGGYRYLYLDGIFTNIGNNGHWWSATKHNSDVDGCTWSTYYDWMREGCGSSDGYRYVPSTSVRCVAQD